jgi:hypothetical protein
MTALTGRRRYRIIFRGECGQLLAGINEDFVIETRQGWTCVTASVRDESEFYGLLDRFHEFALHIVSLDELDADVLRAQAFSGDHQG